MTAPAKRLVTYADLAAVPPQLVAEIIYGALVTHPRPVPRHAVAAFALSDRLGPGYQSGREGPGGWIFMTEPELHLGENVVVPDLAGWRRERLRQLPEKVGVETPPDWVCEILSASTETYDRNEKREIYAAAGVPYLWLLDPRGKLLEAFQLTAGHWLLSVTFSGDVEVRAVPFEAISFPLHELWPLDPLSEKSEDK
jgi:Uma2 family endonuclease